MPNYLLNYNSTDLCTTNQRYKQQLTAGLLRHKCGTEMEWQVGRLHFSKTHKWNITRLHQRREHRVQGLEFLGTYGAPTNNDSDRRARNCKCKKLAIFLYKFVASNY